MKEDNVVRVMMVPGQVRQGDVFATPVTRPIAEEDIGELILDSNEKRVVLAYGEVTGHAHAFYPEQDFATSPEDFADIKEPVASVRLFKLKNADKYCNYDNSLPENVRQTFIKDACLLRLSARALLRHEEHIGIRYAPGDFVINRQHEFDDSELLRRVTD